MAWLRAHAVPLATAKAESGFEDLEPLRSIVGDARVVILGEATHGTREFFQLKHRVLEFLATEMAFNLFAIEGHWTQSLAVNEFVLTGNGDAAEALTGLGFWTWDTEEVLEMIRWMRRYNEDPRQEKKLKFYGVDMQDGWSSKAALLEYLQDVDAEYATEIAENLAPLDRLDSYETIKGYSQWPEDELVAISGGISATLERLVDRKADYVAASSSEEWAAAFQNARVLSQAEETWRQPDWPWGANLRDRFMAENVEWVMENEGPGSRVVLWAHNGHVSKAVWPSGKRMGGYLEQSFGSDAVVFGFAFNQGSFQAWNSDGTVVIEHTVGPAAEGSVSATLAAVGLPLFVVDLRQAPVAGPVAEWLHAEHPERHVGSDFHPDAEPERIAPLEHYDVLVFVERTSRARPTPTGVRDRRP